MSINLMQNKLYDVKFIIIDKLHWFRAVLAIISIYLSISFTMIHQLLVFSCHSCQFIILSDVEFLFFITPSTYFSHYTSGCPRHLPSSDQVIICLGHLLSSMLSAHTISKCCFPVSPKLFVLHFFFFSDDFISYF